MKFLPLIWKNVWRRPLRTLFTLAATVVTFLLFGILAAVNVAFSMGVQALEAQRLVTLHKVSLVQLLPISYRDRIAAVPGVENVTHATWFGGIYQDPDNFFGQMAVETDTFFEMYPEYLVPPEQMKAWKADRTGAIVGRSTAERFGFKVGDKVPIMATFFRRRDGSRLWEFNVSSIYDGAKEETDTTSLFFHYDYLKEGSGFGGLVGWYVVWIEDAARAAEMSKRIDALFANSPAETKTTTEKAWAESFANQVGNIGAMVRAIATAVFFTLLLVVGNTMAQSVRERTSELAVLKTLGFTNRLVLGLVLAESCALAILGGAVGLLLAQAVIPGIRKEIGSFLPVFFFPPRDVLIGAVLAVLLGLVTGLLPGLQAMRLRIVEALRKA